MFSTDTRNPNCTIRIQYTQVMTGGSLHTNELDDRIWRHPSRPLAVIRLTEHSDYSGGDVHASNYRVLWEKFGSQLVQIAGSYGYQALAYDATLGPVPGSEELCEILEDLEEYPLVDEDDHSELESDLELSAWEDHGISDFRRALEKLLDGIDHNHGHELPDSVDAAPRELAEAVSDCCSTAGTWETLLWDLWREGCDQLNVNGGTGFTIETGCTVHFYIDDWTAKAGADRRYPTNKPIHDLLRQIAQLTRV